MNRFFRPILAAGLATAAWAVFASPLAAQQPPYGTESYGTEKSGTASYAGRQQSLRSVEVQPRMAEQVDGPIDGQAAEPTARPSAGAMAEPCAPPARPHYLFLAPTDHGYGHVVPAQAYAYGWFGVCAKPHAVFHWDYFDHRWIWR